MGRKRHGPTPFDLLLFVGKSCHYDLGFATPSNVNREKQTAPPMSAGVSYGSCTDVGKILDTVAALCWTIGCDSSHLPVAASVPEHMEQKAIADIFTALSYGLLTHVSPEPMISGSPLVKKYLTDDLINVTGGKLLLEDNPVKAADAIEAHIMKNRKIIEFD